MRRRGPTVTVRRRGPGLVGTMARTAVVAGTATATIGATQKMMGGGAQKQAAQQQAAAEQAQEAYAAGQQDAMAAQAAAQQAAPQEADNSFDQQLVQIEKLSALKDQGVITEEEFAAKKAQILGI